MADSTKAGMYASVIEQLFFRGYSPGVEQVEFERSDLAAMAEQIGLSAAKNLGDLVYSFKYRRDLPHRIRQTAPEGREWRLVTAGRAKYRFLLGSAFRVTPQPGITQIEILDATPGMIARYALSDEQALLAILRYNRLIDIFTGVTCYSLQSHLRTTVRPDPELRATMPIETDEVYVGVDGEGQHYVFPVQAKGGSDKIALQQIEQDIMLCRQKFSGLKCIPIAAQFMRGDAIALFAFHAYDEEVRIANERHYRLVHSVDETPSERNA